MGDIEFILTYPCFVLLHSNSAPVTFDVEGDDALGLFTDEDLLTQFLKSHPPTTTIARAVIKNADALRKLLKTFQDLRSASGSRLTHLIIDPTSGRKGCCYAIGDFVAHLARPAHNERMSLNVLRSFPDIERLGRQRLQELCDRWLITPVARKCGIATITIRDDLSLVFEAEASHAVEHGEAFHFPSDRLLFFIVDEDVPSELKQNVKAAITSARQRSGPDVNQTFRINKKAFGPKKPLFLTCKNPLCGNVMQTQFTVHGNERIIGGPFQVECPRCEQEHEYGQDEFHFNGGEN